MCVLRLVTLHLFAAVQIFVVSASHGYESDARLPSDSDSKQLPAATSVFCPHSSPSALLTTVSALCIYSSNRNPSAFRAAVTRCRVASSGQRTVCRWMPSVRADRGEAPSALVRNWATS